MYDVRSESSHVNFHIQQQGSDEWEWLRDQTRNYSTRSAYNLVLEASTGGQQEEWCKELWKIKIPSKIKVFAWRLIRDRLPTRMNLHRRQVQLQDLRCPFCREAEEEALDTQLKEWEPMSIFQTLTL